MWPTRSLDLVAIALYCAFVLATAVFAYLKPIAGDDFAALVVMRDRPGLASYVSYWYTHLFGRISSILASYFVIRYSLLFAVLAGLTLPTIAFLILRLALGRRPSGKRHDLLATGFLTVALWFSLPIRSDVYWRSGWPQYSLPAILMLLFLFPYRSWVDLVPVTEARFRPQIFGAAIGMLLLGIAVGTSHEAIVGVVVLLAVGFILLAFRRRDHRTVPFHLWAGLAGLGTGALVLLASPGNASRVASNGGLSASVSHVAAAAKVAGMFLEIWVAPAYPWLVCVLLGGIILTHAQYEERSRFTGYSFGWVWLVAAAISTVPYFLFPQVADERVVFFTTVLLFVAATSTLIPESSEHVLDRLPRVAATVVLAALLVIAVVEVCVGIRNAQGMRRDFAARERIVAEQRASRVSRLVIPPLEHQATSRAIRWEEPTLDPDWWFNRTLAAYYGVESVVSTSAPIR